MQMTVVFTGFMKSALGFIITLNFRLELALEQVVMAVFSYLYLNNWAARRTLTVGYVLSMALQLEPDQMLDFFTKVRRFC